MKRRPLTIRNTSRFPDEEVRELVRFALGHIDNSAVCVNVKNRRDGGPWRGYAYPYIPAISNAPPTARYLITLGVGSINYPHFRQGYKHPHRRDATGGAPFTPIEGSPWPVVELRCWREQLVWLAAHEAKHIEQFKEHRKVSEMACEHFAAKVLRAYREHPDLARSPDTTSNS